MITTVRGYMNELSSIGKQEDEVRQMLKMHRAVLGRLTVRNATSPSPDLQGALTAAEELEVWLSDLLQEVK